MHNGNLRYKTREAEKYSMEKLTENNDVGIGEFLAWVNFVIFSWYCIVYSPETWFAIVVAILFFVIAMYITADRKKTTS